MKFNIPKDHSACVEFQSVFFQLIANTVPFKTTA